MKTSTLFSLVAYPIVGVSAFIGASVAEAASLGTFSFTGSVNASFVANPDAPPALATQLDFLELPLTPPLGTGDVAVSLFDTTGVFTPYNGVSGKIKDVVIADPGVVVAPGGPTVPEFLTIPLPAVGGVPDTTFTLTEVDTAPSLTQFGNDVVISFGVQGNFFSTDPELDGAAGEIVFTAQFVNTTTDAVTADFLDADGLTTDFSAQATAFEAIPEPSATLGLVVLGLGAGALSLKKGQKKI